MQNLLIRGSRTDLRLIASGGKYLCRMRYGGGKSEINNGTFKNLTHYRNSLRRQNFARVKGVQSHADGESGWKAYLRQNRGFPGCASSLL